MGKSLPNYITMEYYERSYLTKDYVIVDKNDRISNSQIDSFNDKKKDQNNKNKSVIDYIYDNMKFW